MARYYYLLAVFEQQPDADACADIFRERVFPLTSGVSFCCTVYLSRSDNFLYWLVCEPQGVNGRPGSTVWVENAGQLDEIAALLYQALGGAVHFLCAIVGWEVQDLFLPDPECGYESNRVYPADFLSPGWDGLVLAEALWSGIGKPDAFQPFSSGYVWIPYKTLSVAGW